MTRDRDETRTATAIDEDLSALLDGELSPSESAAMRARVAEEPALAARLAAFEELGQALDRLAPDRGENVAERLRAALDTRLAEGAPAVIPLDAHPRRRWAIRGPAIAAAMAAGIALLLVLRPLSGPLQPPSPLDWSKESIGQTLDAAQPLELQIALELQVLEDLEVIERLDVLERLAMLDEEAGRG